MSLASIARAMLVSKQNMTGMVARLEQLGFAERSEDARDLRSSRVALTRRGKMLVEKLAPAYEEWLEKTAGNVSARDLQTLSRTVERLIQALEASDPEP